MSGFITIYPSGIYRDVDGDVIKVDADGIATVIGTGHEGTPYIDMTQATWLAALPKDERRTQVQAEPKPVLEDGVYRDKVDGEVVLVVGGEVVAVLETGDGCSTESHLSYYTDDNPDLSVLVRLVAPTDDNDTLPTDGVYADKDGDLVQVKGSQMRYLDSGDPDDLDGWFDLAQEFALFAPYTPLVEAASK